MQLSAMSGVAALKELAQNGARREAVPGLFCGAHRTFALLRNPRKTERGAKQFLVCFVVRTAPFALLRNSRKTEHGAKQFLALFVVRTAPFALLRNSRKTERGSPKRRSDPGTAARSGPAG